MSQLLVIGDTGTLTNDRRRRLLVLEVVCGNLYIET